jgi:carboxypeptidase M
MESLIQQFQTTYPSLVSVSTIGLSVLGNQLYMVQITSSSNTQGKPEVLLVNNMHGDETLGFEMSLHLIDYLTANYDCDPFVKHLLDDTIIFIMPTMNPDGYIANQRGNNNEIDLNRDFPDVNSSPEDTEAGREPETGAVMQFIKSHNIALVIHNRFHAEKPPLMTTQSPTGIQHPRRSVGVQLPARLHAFGWQRILRSKS